ncbi:unnamed protein product [Phytophthora fragariaefolia]|uniref:Unnamed protein product n=1 Tax=Phytophthora fragariaefolia TaxID=1490495 RepID=A0A9W6YFF5_9STRA|nr:unnamed protein product [Phytophthora fragariaefolia]
MSPGHNAFWSFDPRNAATSPVAPPAVWAPETTSTPSRLPIAGYFAEHRRRHGPSTMEDAGEVQVGYDESTDEAPGSPSRSTSGTVAPPTRDASPRVLRTPNPFLERSAGLLALRELSEPRAPPPGTVDSAMEESVVTNDLDEAPSRQVALDLQAAVSRRPVARPLLTPSVRDYGFQPRDPAETARHAASQLLNTYVIGPAARTPEELAQRAALRERFLTPRAQSTASDCESRTSEVRCRPCGLILSFFNLGKTLRKGVTMTRGQTRSVGADPAAPQLITGKCEATDDAVASPRGAVDLSDQKRPRRQGNPAGGAPQTPISFPSGGSLTTLPDTGYAHGSDVSLEYVPRGSGDSPARRATPEAAVVLPQSPLPRSGAVVELSQSLRQLRLLVQDVDQRVYRCCDDIDSLYQRLDWVQVPRELWDRIRGLDDRVAALERWVPYWQDSVRRDEETQRTLAVLRGQIDLLARLREAPPGHYPVTVPVGPSAASSAPPPSASAMLSTPGPQSLPGPGQGTA